MEYGGTNIASLWYAPVKGTSSRMDVGRSTIVFDRMREAIRLLDSNPEDHDSSMHLGETDSESILRGTYLRDALLRSFKPQALSEPEPEGDERPPIQEALPITRSILTDDMRIQSWAKRYSVPSPIVMEGDPVLRD